MSRLTPNTIIDGRYLLTEKISYDTKSGHQVWAAKDTETSKPVFGRFEANGKIDWFPDTRTLASNSSKQKISTIPKIVIPTFKLSQSSSTFRRFIPLLTLFGIGLITIAYYQKEKIQDFWESKFNSSTTEQAEEGQEDVEEANAESVSIDTTLSNASPVVEHQNQPVPTPSTLSKPEDSSVIDRPVETSTNQNVGQSVDNSNVAGTASTIDGKSRMYIKPKRDGHATQKPIKKKPSKQSQNTFVTDSELNKN